MVASARDNIKLWTFPGVALLNTLTGHTGAVTSLAFFSDGRLLASGGTDRTLRIWRVSDPSAVRVWTDGPAPINAIALSPDNSLVAAGSGSSPGTIDGAVRVWDARDGAFVRTLTNSIQQVSDVAFSPDGQLIAAASTDEAVFVWHVHDGALLWTISGNLWTRSAKLAFSPDGKALACGAGSGNSHLGLRRVSDGSLLWLTNAHQGDLLDLAFAPAGNMLASVGSRQTSGAGVETNYPTIILWNPADGTRLGVAASPAPSVHSAAFTHTGAAFLTSESGLSQTLNLWQTNGVLLRDWNGHSSSIQALAFSANGDTIASASYNERSVKFWRVSDGSLVNTLSGLGGFFTTMAFAPDRTFIAVADGTGYPGNKLRFFNVTDGTLAWSTSTYPRSVSSIGFTSTGAALAVAETYGSSYNITIRDASDGAVLQTINNVGGEVIALHFLPTDTTLVSVTKNQAVGFWEFGSSRAFYLQQYPICADFAANGALLAVAYTNREIQLVRLSDGNVQHTLRGHSNPIICISLSVDGQLLYSAAQNELLLWRVADGVLLGRYDQEVLSSRCLAASPRGDAFALGRTDSTFFVAGKPGFFLPLAPAINGTLTLSFSGISRVSYTIQASSDLQSWLPWTNLICSNSPTSIGVPPTGLMRSFYRLSRD